MEGLGQGSEVPGSRLPSNGKVSWSKSLPFPGPQFPHLQKGRKVKGLMMPCLEVWVEMWWGQLTEL